MSIVFSVCRLVEFPEWIQRRRGKSLSTVSLICRFVSIHDASVDFHLAWEVRAVKQRRLAVTMLGCGMRHRVLYKVQLSPTMVLIP